ncbi:MAG: WD40 repeat domain-containing protein, partial [Acaryochloris sp. CRU_2_0]|nr:WD40 repeat domain-containing protein [Acaryochloris sp. CRU_2_0]
CSGDKTVRLWNVDLSLENCKERKELKGHSNWVWSVAFSPDDPTGTTLVSSSDDTTVRVWDTNKDRCQELNHSSRVRAIAVSPNAQILACGCNDGIVWLWKRDSRNNQWEQDRQLQKHSDWIWSVAFSPDSQILASGSEDRTIWLWNVATGQPKLAQPFEAHEGMIYSVAFSPDGQILASGSGDKSVRLWDVSTGKCLKILQGHEGWIWSVAFSPKREDYLLASGSADRTIKLWDVRQIENAYCLKALPELESESEPHTNWVRTIAFSPDGQILASGSDDQKIKLWSVVTGKCFKILEAQGPYENMKITGVRNAEKNTLKALGARE